jgi:hypothetical protein
MQSDSSSNLKVGFYGATPIARQSTASQAAVTITAVTALGTTTLSQVGTSGKFGFATSTAAIALVTRARQMQVDVEAIGVLLNQLRDELVDLNLIKGGA